MSVQPALRDRNFRMCERLRSWYLTDLATCDMWLLRVMFASKITPRFLQLSFGSRVTSSVLKDGVVTLLSIPFEPRSMNSDLHPLSFRLLDVIQALMSATHSSSRLTTESRFSFLGGNEMKSWMSSAYK